jgi:GntR family transcriptional regulator of arabinose operon
MGLKYHNLAAALRTEINAGVYRESGRLPTEMQLSAAHQVSRETVRKALSLLVEEGLIERRQGSGSRVLPAPMRPANNNVAIIATFMDDYIFPSLLYHAQTALEKQGFTTLVFSTQNQLSREQEILQGLLENPVRGILVEGVKTTLPNPNLNLYRRLEEMGVPIVFFHSSYPELECACISDDNWGGGYQAAEHLFSRGHSRIGGIFKCDDVQGVQRCAGFLAAMRDRGLPYPDRQIIWYGSVERQDMVERGDSQWLDNYLTSCLQDCTALICYNDEMAYALVKALLRLGRRVPEDVAVISFDSTYYSGISPVPITSLAHNPGRMGTLAASAMLDLLQGRPTESKRLGWVLVEKQST